MIRITRFLLLPLLVVLTTITLANTVEAAAPRFIMIYGEALEKPIILTDWHENHRFIYSIRKGTEVSGEGLRERPYFKIAFFWGPEWFKYLGKESELRPEEANQHALLYPAYRNAPPVVAFDNEQKVMIPGPQYRSVDEKGVEILLKHKVLVQLAGKTRLTGR